MKQFMLHGWEKGLKKLAKSVSKFDVITASVLCVCVGGDGL